MVANPTRKTTAVALKQMELRRLRQGGCSRGWRSTGPVTSLLVLTDVLSLLPAIGMLVGRGQQKWTSVLGRPGKVCFSVCAPP